MKIKTLFGYPVRLWMMIAAIAVVNAVVVNVTMDLMM